MFDQRLRRLGFKSSSIGSWITYLEAIRVDLPEQTLDFLLDLPLPVNAQGQEDGEEKQNWNCVKSGVFFNLCGGETEFESLLGKFYSYIFFHS